MKARAHEEFRVLLSECSPMEVGALRSALVEGRLDGGRFWSDGKGCVLGTVLATRGVENPSMAAMDEYRFMAVESFAENIEEGTLPDAQADRWSGPWVSALLVQWIDEHQEGAS